MATHPPMGYPELLYLVTPRRQSTNSAVELNLVDQLGKERQIVGSDEAQVFCYEFRNWVEAQWEMFSTTDTTVNVPLRQYRRLASWWWFLLAQGNIAVPFNRGLELRWHQTLTNPLRIAYRAAWVRSQTCSLEKMLLM